MGKRLFAIMMAGVFLLMAAGPGFALEAGNKRKGKYTYRKVYKACQARGEVESNKPIINPDAKTQAQWTRIFEKKDYSDFKCQEEWSKLSKKDLMDIYAYLHAHAADSPTPAKCK